MSDLCLEISCVNIIGSGIIKTIGSAAKNLSFKSGIHGKEDPDVLFQAISELQGLLALENVPSGVRMHLERGWKGVIKPTPHRMPIIHAIEHLSHDVQIPLRTSVIGEERQETRSVVFPCEAVLTNFISKENRADTKTATQDSQGSPSSGSVVHRPT
jgi:hypothetical protein